MRLISGQGWVSGIVAALAGVALFAVPVQAQTPAPSPSPVSMSQIPEHPEHPVVVELFASQGCGNCPKAVQVLAEMARRSDVIGLTYPVGIWDYLGWSDTFAKQEFAERQKAYNVAMQNRGPYTPQMVFSGRYHSSGVNLERIAEKFAQRNVTPLPAKVSIGPGELAVTGTFDGPATVMLIRYMPGITHTTPGAGANRGKPMDYFNLVTSVQMLGPAASGQTTKFKADCSKACAVLVQTKASTGWIIGAAQSR
jgi:hypothetical protein